MLFGRRVKNSGSDESQSAVSPTSNSFPNIIPAFPNKVGGIEFSNFG